MSSRNTCGSNACTCRSNGLNCVTACGDCMGYGCHNSVEFDDEIIDDDVNDDNIPVDGNIFERIFNV